MRRSLRSYNLTKTPELDSRHKLAFTPSSPINIPYRKSYLYRGRGYASSTNNGQCICCENEN